mmetsp:Transcript_156557/g.380177  ORF Transcript_156557/g.380177 Transcript_156557/m.380177 type:complete len:908 (+) Transcript_156557:130-2853(+)
MPKKIELSILGETDGPIRCLEVDDDAKVGSLRIIISQATGTPPEKLKLVALKGRAMTSLGDGERVPKSVKVGGATSLDSVGEEKPAALVASEAAPEEEERGAPPPSLAPRGAPPPPREPRQPRAAVAAAKPKAVSKEEAAAKAAARKAREAARATGQAPPAASAVKAPPPAAAQMASGYPPAAAQAVLPTQPQPPPPKAQPPPPKAQPQAPKPQQVPPQFDGFTLESALMMQEEMKSAFSSREFQDALGQLHWDTQGMKMGERNKLYKALLLEVQKAILPRYGFEGSSGGVQTMLFVFQEKGYNDHPAVDANTAAFNTLISMDIAGQALAARVAEEQKAATKASKPWDEVPWEVTKPKAQPPQQPALAKESPAPEQPPAKPEQSTAPQQPFDLLAQYVKAGWTPPSKEQLIAMQKDLIAGYMQPEFQQKLRALPAGPSGFQAKGDLLWTVQAPVIARYGFEPTQEGLTLSGAVFTRDLNRDPEIAKNNEELFISLDVGMQERRAQAKAKAAAKAATSAPTQARTIELVLHGSKDLPSTLVVEGDSSVGSVKQLVAEATCMAPEAIALLWKPVGSAPPVAMDDRAKCPPKVQVRGPDRLCPGGALLPRARAKQLQGELMVRYEAPAFQQRLAGLAGKPQQDQRKLLRQLCLEEQKKVLPKYGFEGTPEGVLVMLLSFQLVQKDMTERGDAEMIQLMAKLNDLLDLSKLAGEVPQQHEAEPPPAQPREEAFAPTPAASFQAPIPVVPAQAPKQTKPPAAAGGMSWMSAMLVDYGEDDEDEGGAETDEEEAAAIWGGPPPEQAKQPPTAVAPKVPAPVAGLGASVAKATAIAFSSTPQWTVVGGGDKGGILVRRTADLHSPELGRLSTGSIMKEKKLQGDRLQYEKESGDGPDSGWVSLTFKGSELVRRI